ncbi:MAG: ATP-binding protein [Ktedonobacterales bacterium]|nr:ATP-binding protein [Ktedonobacterales bacterium]
MRLRDTLALNHRQQRDAKVAAMRARAAESAAKYAQAEANGKRAAAEQAALRQQHPCCGGSGYRRPDVPFGHPLFGKAVKCEEKGCRCHAAILQGRIEKLSLMPKDLIAAKATWRTFPVGVDRVALASVRNYAKGINTEREQQRGMVLYGKNQIGKTGMAFCLHNELRDATVPSVFIRVVDFLDRCQVAKLNDEEPERFFVLMDNFAGVTHLVLDDLGAEKSSDFREECLYKLLDRRAKDPACYTTITTNLDLLELRDKVGDRVYSRFGVGDFYLIKVAGEMGALKGSK